MSSTFRRLLLALAFCGLLTGAAASPALAGGIFVTVDTPYIHDGAWSGNRFIQTNAYGSNYPIRATLFQHYGGRWNVVATSGIQSAYSVKASVHCGGARKNYSFQSRGEAWVGGVWQARWSAVVVRAC